MPTPESAAFLAKKPTVPPTFDGVDYEDNTALKAAQDAIIREQWVHTMMARLVRQELSKCYRREGVNHLAKCGVLRGELRMPFCSARKMNGTNRWRGAGWIERYMELLKDSKIKGYIFEQRNYMPKK